MKKQHIFKIQFRTYEYKWLKRSITQLQYILNLMNQYNSYENERKINITYLPKKYSYFTLIRSPHIDKKSGEKLIKELYKANIIITDTIQPYLYQSLLDIIKQINWLGTETQITFYTTDYYYEIK